MKRSLAHILRPVLGASGALAQHLPKRALQRGAQGPPVAHAPPGAGCICRSRPPLISLPGATPFIDCASTTKGSSINTLCCMQCCMSCTSPESCFAPCTKALQHVPAYVANPGALRWDLQNSQWPMPR